ncbi:MAG: serine/threonine-protein kinase [Acidimicrobiales bacterium]
MDTRIAGREAYMGSRFTANQNIDHYELLQELGEGSYAETWKARDVHDGRVVVLKLANPQLFADPVLFQRYRRESEIACHLDHPHVQRAFRNTQSSTEPYLVLEYVDGESLRTRLRNVAGEDPSGKLPIAVAVDWGHQLAEALSYLHAHGVIHRDLKPENVLAATSGVLKVMDFGTAMMTGARRLTWKHVSEGLGTPDYMSPEQVQGGRGDVRSDIYSWGVVMYEMLTGKVPFEGDNWLAVMAGHLQGTPVPPRRLRPDIPAGLETVVLHALRRYPDNRYQTAEDLLSDLDRIDTLDTSIYDTSAEPPMGGMAALARRSRTWVLAAVVAIGFLLLATLIVVLSVVLR